MYCGVVREDLLDDIIQNVVSQIEGDQCEIDNTIQRIRDFINLISRYKIAPYIHLELEMHKKNLDREKERNTPSCWHRELLDDDPIFGGAKFTVAITGERTLFIPTNEYNRSIMDREELGEKINLIDTFRDEKVIFSKSDEVSIFGGSIIGTIHSGPLNHSNRIFLNAVFGSHDEMYRDAICAGVEDEWNLLSHERV